MEGVGDTAGPHLGLGQGVARAADHVLLAHAKLLRAVRPHDHLHLAQRRVPALPAEQPPRLLRATLHARSTPTGTCSAALLFPSGGFRRQEKGRDTQPFGMVGSSPRSALLPHCQL